MFEQFRPFVGVGGPPNCFWPVDPATLEETERQLRITFPPELRTFYQEVGYGFFKQGIKDKKPTHVNRVLSPISIRELVTNTANPARPAEGFPPHAIPFFELGESTYFLVKPTTVAPNRVYAGGQTVITESLHDFFDRLYRNAAFYRECL